MDKQLGARAGRATAVKAAESWVALRRGASPVVAPSVGAAAFPGQQFGAEPMGGPPGEPISDDRPALSREASELAMQEAFGHYADEIDGSHTDAAGTDAGATEDGVSARTVGTNAAVGTGTAAGSAVTRGQVLTQIQSDDAYVRGGLLQTMRASSDPTIKNTADYCVGNSPISGQLRAIISPITPTHDSAARAQRARKRGQVAWCWGTSYADGSDSNITYGPPNLGGLHQGNKIGLVVTRSHSPLTRFPEADIINFLVHEVQHDADHHENMKEPTPTGGNAGAWTAFKTEFRSYWVDGGYSSKSDTDKAAPMTKSITNGANTFTISATNDRAMAIKSHILGGAAYATTATAYRTNAVLKGQLDGLNRRDGANLTNDPKVDDFLRAISMKKTSKLSGAWKAMNASQHQTLYLNPQARLLIRSNYHDHHIERILLLGFIDGILTVAEHDQLRSFLDLVELGLPKHGLAAPARALSGQTRRFLTANPDFRTYATYWTKLRSWINQGLTKWDLLKLVRP